eukprot:scaffold18648_cov124-Isochrysis_galbana.AAC.14
MSWGALLYLLCPRLPLLESLYSPSSGLWTMDEHFSKWRYLVGRLGLANCPRRPRGLPIA